MNHTHHHHDHSDAVHEESNISIDDHRSMMKMFFHTGFIETILFKSWTTDSTPLFISSWIFIFILSILYEGMREFHQYSRNERSIQNSRPSNDKNKTESEPMNTESSAPAVPVNKKISLKCANHILHSLLYTVYLSLSYILMLIAMTFNVYLFLAIISGMGAGHFLFTLSCIRPSTTDTEESLDS